MSFWTHVGPADGLNGPWERKHSLGDSGPPTLSAFAKSPPQKGPDVPGSLTEPQKKKHLENRARRAPPGTMGVRMASSPMVGPCLTGFIEAAYRLLFNAARGLESAVEIRVTILARPPYTRTRTRAHTHTHTHTRVPRDWDTPVILCGPQCPVPE